MVKPDEEQPATAMAAPPTTMDTVSLREIIIQLLSSMPPDPRMAVGAGNAMESTWKVAERLAGAS